MTCDLDDIARLIISKRRVVLLVGAGISVSCGIPDFRSPATGLYSRLDLASLDLDAPEDLFDIECFRDDPRRFYKVASNLFYQSRLNLKPSISHEFVKLLSDINLLRVYTQNIDGLEEIAGVPRKCIIEAHGSLQRAQCLKCHKILDSVSEEHVLQHSRIIPLYQYIQSSLKTSNVPTCPRVVVTCRKKRKLRDDLLTTESSSYQVKTPDSPDVESHRICGGILKPGITFFGEKLNTRVGNTLESDKEDVDLLIVMGTSLSVAPMSDVLGYFPKDIPKVLINKTMIQPRFKTQDLLFDACLLGDCDQIILQLVSRMNVIAQCDTLQVHKKKGLGTLLSSFCVRHMGSKMLMDGQPQSYTALKHEKMSLPINLYNHPEDRILLFPSSAERKDWNETTALISNSNVFGESV